MPFPETPKLEFPNIPALSKPEILTMQKPEIIYYANAWNINYPKPEIPGIPKLYAISGVLVSVSIFQRINMNKYCIDTMLKNTLLVYYYNSLWRVLIIVLLFLKS